ncbi:MAG: NAD-dependent 4,6-dehydratase LegB [Ignavibacteria bacterium]|nr:NAD-dependent 4,6-dehydratase LegB [Ignavibacteria bacterium]
MKKVLVTGSAGFIGSHLTEFLVNKGFEVKAFVRYNSKNNWGWLENSSVKNNIQVYTGDIRDYDAVYSALKDCDGVFHLAALIGIPYSYVSPKAYIETNITGTYNILQAARELQLEQVLVTSTSETYGTAQYVPIDELHPMVGQSPYSATKIAADQLSISYFRSFGLPVKVVRPFNTYGPRQSARAIIPTIISQILDGKRELTLGNLAPTRDLTFVKDTCKGFYEISQSNSLFGEITNVGMHNEISVKGLVDLISEIMQVELTINTGEERVRPGKSEVERLVCNNEKVKKHTAWAPDYDLRSGLEATINWLRDNMQYYKSDIYNI